MQAQPDLPGIPPAALRVQDAARMLQVSPSAIWAMLRRGELTRIRIGRLTRISAAELAAKLNPQN